MMSVGCVVVGVGRGGADRGGAGAEARTEHGVHGDRSPVELLDHGFSCWGRVKREAGRRGRCGAQCP